MTVPTIVDSCVLLDILTRDPNWFDWSSSTVYDMAEQGSIILNPIIYAEISVGFDRIADLEESLPAHVFEYHPISREIAFLAGKCFALYRKRGGTKRSPLPDFFIGAHAAVENLPLVTRDVRRFRNYFPRLQVISP